MRSIGAALHPGLLAELEDTLGVPVLEDARLGWRDFARAGFQALTVPGDHASLFLEPHVADLAAQLERVLAQAVLG